MALIKDNNLRFVSTGQTITPQNSHYHSLYISNHDKIKAQPSFESSSDNSLVIVCINKPLQYGQNHRNLTSKKTN